MSIKLKTALFDENGKRISEYYEFIWKYSDGTIKVMKNWKEYWNKINKDGTLFCKKFYRSEHERKDYLDFGHYYAIKVTLEDESQNLITRDGTLILKRKDYIVLGNMKSYYALVQKNGKYNIVDRTGRVISKMWFNAISFDDHEVMDMWKVELPNGKYNLLKRDGTLLLKKSVTYNEIKDALNK